MEAGLLKIGRNKLSGKIFACLVILLGCIVLTGWTFEIIPFRRFLPRMVSMNPLTAVSFILVGIALLNVHAKGYRLLFCIGPCIIVCLACLLKLTIFIPGWKIPIDTYIFYDRIDDNRMAPNTAINLFLSGLSVIFISRKSEKAIATGQALGLVTFLVALSAIMGYMYNITSANAVNIFFPIAFHTALCFLFLSLGIFLSKPDNGFIAVITAHLLGGSLSRRLLPFAILLPLVLEWFRFEASQAGIIQETLSVSILIIMIVFILSLVIWVYSRSLNEFDRYRQQSEKNLVESKNAAEEARKTQELFLANMSHEIRTPMNAVIGMTSLLQQSNMSEDQKGFVDTIRISGESLLGIINDILDFSKIQAGKMELEQKPFSLHNVIEETFILLSNEAKIKNLELSYLIQNNVPDILVGDVTRMRQVLVNLVSNGIKFTERGGISVEVSANGPSAMNNVELEFRINDTGVGIAPDKIEKLFKAFSQLDASTTRKFGGTGLGLAICHRLVQLMDGKIGVESKPGIGTTFWFTAILGVGSKQRKDNTIDSLPSNGTGKDNSFGKNLAKQIPLRILVADDNAINLRLVLKMLENFGYKADMAANGLEALEAMKRQYYDFILMDMVMPEMDGLEAAARIRELPLLEQPIIIALTANVLYSDNDKHLTDGINDWLTKPFRLSDIENLITKWFVNN